jgi:peptidoglycan/xylan/chitin deacetylase (PgdA/CDA1 family)
MTRFHIAIIAAGLASVAAWMAGSLILAGIAIGALVIVIGLGVVLPQLSLFGTFVCHGDRSRRCVAITFDDGPDARSTPMLLDWLRDEQIAATFFCIGKNVAANHELAARILREGHLLGNHTFNHRNTTNFFTVARLHDELAATQAAIQNATGIAPQWFRPPMGLSNPRMFRVTQALGLKVIGWSARGLDTVSNDPQKIVARILRQLKPGAIILLHDGKIPNDRLLMTVKLLSAKLRERGYEIVRLDKILK